MFTGLIEDIGKINSIEKNGIDTKLIIETNLNTKDINLGDSIAINGICLTVTSINKNKLCFDASYETILKTNLNNLKINDKVNLEQALMLKSRLGGHLVSGHIDTISTLKNIKYNGKSIILEIEIPTKFTKYIVEKGSITIDGVSLTVNYICNNIFSVNVIPHTKKNTIINFYKIGQIINIEIDVFAKYVEKLLKKESYDDENQNSNLTYDSLFKL